MPALKNARHERFAQELAKGRTQAEAYAEAGYAPSEPNASRLTSNDKVAARVAEIQERGAVRSEVTIASITSRLLAIATKGELKDEAPMLQAARAALMDAAKLNGLVVDTVEKINLPPEQRRARIAALEARQRELLGGSRDRTAGVAGAGASRH